MNKLRTYTLRQAYIRWLALRGAVISVNNSVRVPAWFTNYMKSRYVFMSDCDSDNTYCNRCEMMLDYRRDYLKATGHTGRYYIYVSDAELLAIQPPVKRT